MTIFLLALVALGFFFLPRLTIFIIVGCVFGWAWAFGILGMVLVGFFLLGLAGALSGR